MSEIVAFDFDGTLTVEDGMRRFQRWNWRMLDRLRWHDAKGDAIVIVTARYAPEMDEHLSARGQKTLRGFPLVHASVQRLRLPVQGVIFTEGNLKGPYLTALEVNLLYDDQAEQRSSAIEHGVRARLPLKDLR
jgi:hypothetical protein